MKSDSKHDLKQKKQDSKLGKLGEAKVMDGGKKDKVKQSEDGKDFDIMKQFKKPHVGHNSKKPKLGDELAKYPKDRK